MEDPDPLLYDCLRNSEVLSSISNKVFISPSIAEETGIQVNDPVRVTYCEAGKGGFSKSCEGCVSLLCKAVPKPAVEPEGVIVDQTVFMKIKEGTENEINAFVPKTVQLLRMNDELRVARVVYMSFENTIDVSQVRFLRSIIQNMYLRVGCSIKFPQNIGFSSNAMVCCTEPDDCVVHVRPSTLIRLVPMGTTSIPTSIYSGSSPRKIAVSPNKTITVTPTTEHKKKNELPESEKEAIPFNLSDSKDEKEKIVTTNKKTSFEEFKSSVGGLDTVYKDLRELVLLPVLCPEAFIQLQVESPKGVLLSGPPGVGKTLLVRTLCAEASKHVLCRMFVINGPEVFGSGVGEGEAKLRQVFADASEHCKSSLKAVSVVFLDELDSLCPKRESGSTVENRLVGQLLTLLDGIENRGSVIVIGATNRPDSLDIALRRPGRLDRELLISPPDNKARLDIIKVHSSDMPLTPEAKDWLPTLADKCIGFVGADLAGLCQEASMIALKEQLHSSRGSSLAFTNKTKQMNMKIDIRHLDLARTHVGASSLRQFRTQAAFKEISWDQIGGYEKVKTKLRQIAEWPVTKADACERLGLEVPRGVLLYGPPGCSKTTLVRALVTATGASFFALSGADVFSCFVGDAEASIRRVFLHARRAAPAIVFLDEIDAIVSSRSDQGGGSGVAARVLSTLLNEMDGVEAAKGVLVVGATNRREALDSALLRAGRFEVQLKIGLPDKVAREHILRIHTKKIPNTLNDDDYTSLTTNSDGFSGAELENICREAALLSLREDLNATSVPTNCFERSLEKMRRRKGIDGENITKKTQAPQMFANLSKSTSSSSSNKRSKKIQHQKKKGFDFLAKM